MSRARHPLPTDLVALVSFDGRVYPNEAKPWDRLGLDQRARRWITLVGVCDSAAYMPIHTHIHAAMMSGNADQAEMFEFVLHYAVHSGWPRASVAQGAVIEQGAQVAKGLAFGVKGDGQ